MEIEEVAHTSPEAVAQDPGVAARRRGRRQGRARSSRPAIPGRLRRRAPPTLIEKLWTVFVEEDATLVEVNPLVLTDDGQVLALDGKVTLDDNAEFRQEHAALEDKDSGRPAGGRGQGEAPQLRQARRRGRHHRQRRRPRHVHPGRGRLRR